MPFDSDEVLDLGFDNAEWEDEYQAYVDSNDGDDFGVEDID